MAETIDMSVLLGEFVDDASGHLDAAETSIMELEKVVAAGGTGDGFMTLLLGNLHTLKGNSGMMGFTALQQFIHRLESIVKLAAEETLTLNEELFEALYASVSALREALQRLADDPGSSPDFSDELTMLEYLASGTVGVSEQTGSTAAFTRDRRDEFSYITQKSNTLKVNFEKLDDLLNLVGELVIHRTTLVALEARLKESVKERSLLEAFNEASLLIGKSANELRESIMKVRMLPIKVVFQRFNRLVRDLAQRHHKEIELRFEGEETELDKTVIDEIGEPLLHLIRNAVDHGFESPSERLQAGKARAGRLVLSARHESNNILVSVRDDGRGMDARKIGETAVAKGLLESREIAATTDAELCQLVFLPGFSTSSEVTETSGRGIGLDVVKKIVTSFNGIIDIESSPGLGTCFTIKLPLTLAIIQALMVEVAGEVYAVPLTGVLESLRVGSSEIHEVGSGEMIRLRDRLLPIHRLDRYFGRSTGLDRAAEYVVVVGSGEKRAGLVVDRLIGQQEVVIKALDDYLGDLPGIAGATVLGDGRVSLILDIAQLVGSNGINRGQSA